MFLHVGDYDPSGESIFDAMTRDVEAFVEEDRVLATSGVIPVRVALTLPQVARFNLPTSPPKSSDARTAGWLGVATCQLEALPPNVLAGVVDSAIYQWVDEDVLGEVVEDERDERTQLLGLPRGTDDKGTSR